MSRRRHTPEQIGMPPVSVPLLMLDLETVEGQQAGAF